MREKASGPGCWCVKSRYGYFPLCFLPDLIHLFRKLLKRAYRFLTMMIKLRKKLYKCDNVKLFETWLNYRDVYENTCISVLPQFQQQKKKQKTNCGHVLVSQIQWIQVKQYLCEILVLVSTQHTMFSGCFCHSWMKHLIWTSVSFQAWTSCLFYHLGHWPCGCTYKLTWSRHAFCL